MVSLLVNIDVPDIEASVTFYTRALGLTVGRRLGASVVELVGGSSPIYLLEKTAGSVPGAGVGGRRYGRHWTPVHLDVAVEDLDAALARAVEAGAVREREVEAHAWGRIGYLADPFGNGFCLLQFSARGYDAIADAG
ncbi:MAG TPA: VOC family protein [Candidatus Binatia bacterium]|jgi:predicted enzyme related to lactoylglutathione lyase|nr:VOC family protein [Candidatus Binatia bacterium]